MKRNWTAAVALTATAAFAGVALGQAYPEYDRRQNNDRYASDAPPYASGDRYESESPQSQERQQEDREAYRNQQQRTSGNSPAEYGGRASDDRGRELDYADRYDREPLGRGQRDERRQERDSLGSDRFRRSEGRAASFSERGERRPTGRVRDAIAEWAADWWRETTEQSDVEIDASSAGQFIRQHDSDDDGYLSWSELPRDLRPNFNQLDTDGDLYLSERELRQHALHHARIRVPVEVTYIWVVGADRGRMELEDINEAYEVMRRIDYDGDGYIARSELRQRQQQVLSNWLNRIFVRLDSDNDDRITSEEARRSMLVRNFETIDSDGSGDISRSELRDALRAHASVSLDGGERSAAVPTRDSQSPRREDSWRQEPSPRIDALPAQQEGRFENEAGLQDRRRYDREPDARLDRFEQQSAGRSDAEFRNQYDLPR